MADGSTSYFTCVESANVSVSVCACVSVCYDFFFSFPLLLVYVSCAFGSHFDHFGQGKTTQFARTYAIL